MALAVSAIPEGLPVAMTVALAVATGRMARRAVIVRRLAAVAPRCTVRVGDEPEAPRFRRGDADGSGEVDLTDVVHLLNWLFLAGPPSRCADAADASDAGELNVTTAVYLLNWLFLGGPDLPAPGIFCGADASEDTLDCVQYEGC